MPDALDELAKLYLEQVGEPVRPDQARSQRAKMPGFPQLGTFGGNGHQAQYAAGDVGAFAAAIADPTLEEMPAHLRQLAEELRTAPAEATVFHPHPLAGVEFDEQGRVTKTPGEREAGFLERPPAGWDAVAEAKAERAALDAEGVPRANDFSYRPNPAMAELVRRRRDQLQEADWLRTWREMRPEGAVVQEEQPRATWSLRNALRRLRGKPPVGIPPREPAFEAAAPREAPLYESRPGRVERFFRSAFRPATEVAQRVEEATVIPGKIREMVDLERNFRLKVGAFEEEDVSTYRHAGVNRVSTARLERLIELEILNGLPLLNEKAQRLQREFYDWQRERGRQMPPPEDLSEKFAQFGGDLAGFIAAMSTVKRPAQASARGLVRGAGMPASMAPTVGTGIAAGAVTGLETGDPQAALNSALFMGGAGAAGKIGAGIGREAGPMLGRIARQRTREMIGHFVGDVGFWSGQAAVRGADWDDIIVEGIAGPIAFNLPAFFAFGSYARAARLGDSEHFRVDGDGVHTRPLSGLEDPNLRNTTTAKLVLRMESLLRNWGDGQDVGGELKGTLRTLDRVRGRMAERPQEYSGAERRLMDEWFQYARSAGEEALAGVGKPEKPVSRPPSTPAEGGVRGETRPPAGRPQRPRGGGPGGEGEGASVEPAKPSSPAERTRPAVRPRPIAPWVQRELWIEQAGEAINAEDAAGAMSRLLEATGVSKTDANQLGNDAIAGRLSAEDLWTEVGERARGREQRLRDGWDRLKPNDRAQVLTDNGFRDVDAASMARVPGADLGPSTFWLIADRLEDFLQRQLQEPPEGWTTYDLPPERDEPAAEPPSRPSPPLGPAPGKRPPETVPDGEREPAPSMTPEPGAGPVSAPERPETPFPTGEIKAPEPARPMGSSETPFPLDPTAAAPVAEPIGVESKPYFDALLRSVAGNSPRLRTPAFADLDGYRRMVAGELPVDIRAVYWMLSNAGWTHVNAIPPARLPENQWVVKVVAPYGRVPEPIELDPGGPLKLVSSITLTHTRNRRSNQAIDTIEFFHPDPRRQGEILGGTLTLGQVAEPLRKLLEDLLKLGATPETPAKTPAPPQKSGILEVEEPRREPTEAPIEPQEAPEQLGGGRRPGPADEPPGEGPGTGAGGAPVRPGPPAPTGGTGAGSSPDRGGGGAGPGVRTGGAGGAVPGERPPRSGGRPAEPGTGGTTGGGPEPASVPEPGGEGGRPAARPAEPEPVAEPAEPTGEHQPSPSPEQQAEPLATEDFVITPSFEQQLFKAGRKTWARWNLEAIELSQRLVAEGRRPTAAEQEVLARYSGWGALKDIFNQRKEDWEELRERFRDLVTADEYYSALNSTKNAFYTPPYLIRAMWDAVVRMGFGGGAVLEPAVGVGHFFGLMPPDVGHVARFGTELDRLSGTLAQQLYPNSRVAITPFEKARLPEQFFRLIISNVPFDELRIQDERYPGDVRRVHDYFFARSADLLAPGGVIAFVTSSGTMDKPSVAARAWLNERLRFIGAVRLHNKALPGTAVTADIVFLQKPEPGVAVEAGPAWLRTVRTKAPSAENPDELVAVNVNEYFVAHPEMILGRMRQGSMYHAESEATTVVVDPTEGVVTEDALREALARLPEGIISDTAIRLEDIPAELTEPPVPDDVPRGAHVLRTNRINRHDPGSGNLIDVQDQLVSDYGKPAVPKMRWFLDLRDKLLRLMQLERDPDAEAEQVEAARKALNDAYDRGHKRWGPISKPSNLKILANDVFTTGLVRALENYNRKTRTAEKTGILRKRVYDPRRVVTEVDDIGSGILVSLDRVNRLDWDLIARLTSRSVPDLQREALENDLVFEDPAGGWALKDEYLSGNVRRKLRHAEEAARNDPARWQRNVEALQSVMPADVGPSKIGITLGATWVPANYYTQFARELFAPDAENLARNIDIRYSRESRSFIGEFPEERLDSRPEVNSTWGTVDMPAYTILMRTLNLKAVEVRDTEYYTDNKGNQRTRSVRNEDKSAAAEAKQEEMRQEWTRWAWKDPTRADVLVRIFNEKLNSNVPRQYDGSYLSFPGMSVIWRERLHARKYQPRLVARWLQTPTSMLVNAVTGSGKTVSILAAATESIRLRMSSKNAIAVQLSTYQQYLQTAREVYPAGNFLFLDADEMKGDKLQINLGRISVGDYDTVILPHTTVEKIPMSKEYLAEFRDWIRDRIHDAIQRQAPQRGDRDVVRRLRNALQKLEDMLQNMIDDQQRKRVSLTWEQLGVDMLFVDEAQKYKNLWYMTQLDHVKGLGNPDGSKRALDMWLKIRYANQKTGGKGAMLATGTPIANTIAELYTVMRYVAPGILEEMQIEGADEWISMFAEVSAEVEPTIEGGYAAVMRMRRLRNLPQLITTANTHFMESVTHEEVAGHVELPLIEENPQGRREPTTITIEGSDEIDWVMHRVALLGRWIRRNFRDALEMRLNFLVLTDIIRKLAIDPRLINERFTAGGKLKAIVDQVVDTYHDSTEAKDRTDPHSGETYQSPDRGVQAVFFVIGTPKADPQPNATGSRFNPVNEFVDMLVEAGIPREEIGLVWDYNRNNIADGLLEDARRGRKRVLIGSPEKLGIGTNFHDRLRALHIVSPPWRPDEIQQPYGRIIRPGNGFKEVRIVHYVTKGTGDELMYALLRTKMEFIASFLKGKVEGGDVEIDNRESFQLQEINALASKNPALLEFAEKSRDLRRLRGGEKAFRDSRAKNEGDLAYARNRLRTLERDLPKYQKLAAAVEPAADVVVRGQTFGASAKRLDIAKALWKAAHDLLAETRPGTTQTLGSIGNVAVIGEREASRFGDERPLAVRVLFAGQRGEFSELNVGRTLTVNESAQQHWNSVRAMLSDPATVVSNLQAGIEELRSRIRSLERGLREAAAEFPEAAQLQQVQEEVNALQGQIAQGGGQISDAEVANLRVAATPRYFDPVEGGLEAWLQQRREAAQDMITDEGRALMEEHAERQVRAGAMPPPLAPPAVRERALELFNPMRPAIEHDRTWLGETTPEQREWLRKRIQAGRPGFGMGAMVNVPPDARTAAQRAYDAIRGRFYDLPPGKLRRAVRGIGRGLFGRLWHNTAKDAMHLRGFEDIRGRTREARLDVEPVVGDVVKLGERLNAEGGWDADRIRELEDRRRKSERGEGPPVDPLELTPEEQMWNRVGEAADTGDWSQLSREEEQILRRYQALLARVNDRFWTMPEQWRDAVSKFGLLNVQDIMRSLQERGIVYLRRLYKPRRNLTYQAPPVLSKEKRMVGPRIGDSMFRFRRSDYDLWTVTLVNGQKLQFLDEEEAYEFAERHREENRERFGTNVNNVVRVLDPLEKPIVEALQPERNLGMRMLRTLVQWSTNVEVLRVFGHLADTVGLTEGELPGDFDPDSNDYNLARLPDVPTLGPLAGKWVPEAVAYNVMEMDTTRVGLLGGIHDLYLYLWKFSKVVANPATWARQLYGLNFSWVLDGIHPVTHAKWYSAAAREMRERGRYWRYLVQTNDITTGFAEQMQDDLLDRLNSGARFVEAVQESARAFLRGTDKVGRGYDWIDQISKLASFMHKVDKLGYTWVDARDSLWMYPNYDRIGTWANRIRKSAWGAPFWAFNGSAVQWNIRGLRQHPGRLAMMWLAPGALTLLSILLLGLDDEERELADKGRTYWQPLLPWKDTHGRAQTLDCQWIFPLANDFRVDTGPGGLGFTFLFGQPITKWALETAGAHDLFSGRRLYTPDDTPREKLQKFVAHTAATLTPLPNIATRGVPRIISESLRRQDESELLRTLLKEVLGLNIRAPYVRRRDALAILRRHFEAADVNAVADLLEVWNEHYAVWDRPIRSGDIRQSMKARARAREK